MERCGAAQYVLIAAEVTEPLSTTLSCAGRSAVCAAPQGAQPSKEELLQGGLHALDSHCPRLHRGPEQEDCPSGWLQPHLQRRPGIHPGWGSPSSSRAMPFTLRTAACRDAAWMPYLHPYLLQCKLFLPPPALDTTWLLQSFDDKSATSSALHHDWGCCIARSSAVCIPRFILKLMCMYLSWPVGA